MSSPLLLLLLVLLTGSSVRADYRIEFSIESFDHPTNTLSNGDCCQSEGANPCMMQCNSTFSVCFRESNHPHNEEEECDDLVTIGDPSSVHKTAVIEKYYRSSFQAYIRVSQGTVDQPDPLIDLVFIELVEVQRALYRQPNIQKVIFSGRGELQNTTLTLSLTVRCAETYFGEACERLCRSDGTNCRIIHIGPVVYKGYNISVTDSVVVVAVILMVLGVLVCIVGDHIRNRKWRTIGTAAVTAGKEQNLRTDSNS